MNIHVEVDRAISVADGHAVGHAIQVRIRAGLLTVRAVLVHIEPADPRPNGG